MARLLEHWECKMKWLQLMTKILLTSRQNTNIKLCRLDDRRVEQKIFLFEGTSTLLKGTDTNKSLRPFVKTAEIR